MRMRLHPFVSFGDSQKIRGNQNIHLIDETTIVVKIGRKEGGGRSGRTVTRTARLDLAKMRGATATIMRQLADICSRPDTAHRINVSYFVGDTHVSITFDPNDLPNHPQRRRPVVPKKGRALGIDLNPNWIGLAVASNGGDASKIEDTEVLEYALVKLDMAVDSSPELVRETLAAVCDRAISMARKHRCGTIVLEKGLGKLRSSGKSRSLNRLLNYWARTVFVQMLTRRARLAGIEVLEVWAGYSSTIGNLAFNAPDACASATEIARRGIAHLVGIKDVLPALEVGCVSRLWKNGKVPAELGSWQDVHRTIKAAKIGYRRPHPDVPIGARGSDVHGTRLFRGHAVVRLGRRYRPELLFRPVVASAKPDAIIRTF
jgi:IS605 OrfB family transposase